MPSGFPPHLLTLKVGAVVVLLRNISVFDGLCNGTRMVVTRLGDETITCQILTGNLIHRQKIVHISRFEFTVKEKGFLLGGLYFKRLQFPLRLAFCMTINKAQGQTASRVGLLLETSVFSSGQLYVALSRVRTADSIRIFIPHNPEAQEQVVTKNMVAPGVNF